MQHQSRIQDPQAHSLRAYQGDNQALVSGHQAQRTATQQQGEPKPDCLTGTQEKAAWVYWAPGHRCSEKARPALTQANALGLQTASERDLRARPSVATSTGTRSKWKPGVIRLAQCACACECYVKSPGSSHGVLVTKHQSLTRLVKQTSPLTACMSAAASVTCPGITPKA